MTVDSKRQIFDQINYYFSDINLRNDKFLKEKIAEDSDGWVAISVLLVFNRLKSMTEEASTVVEAVEEFGKKDDSSLIELSEDKTKIRRTTPFVELTEEQMNELNSRSVHFKGFPQDATLDEIKKFCAQFGTVLSVEMRRFREDRKFKGCVHVIYSNKDDAVKAVESSEVYSADIKFLRESKVDYLKRKAEFWAQRNARKLNKKSDQASELSTGNDDQDPVKVKSCVLLVSNVPSDLPFNVIKETMKHHGSVQYVDIDPEKKTATVRFSKENEAISVLKTASASSKGNKDGEEVEKASIEGDVKVAADASVESDSKADESSDKQAEKENDGQGETELPTKGEIVIKEQSYQAEVLAGEAEVNYWLALNEFRRTNTGNSNRNKYHGKKGRGFKRGGGGYKGTRSSEGHGKRANAGDNASASAAKKVKADA